MAEVRIFLPIFITWIMAFIERTLNPSHETAIKDVSVAVDAY
ncbi:uncharacterized protein METZ01_LOCUS101220 [marine metagenome]|uniref:Uncharacterized protein n=1 Tax=marine metagenome TaxID=408172 RepID=A0A381W739_9ZZZZ